MSAPGILSSEHVPAYVAPEDCGEIPTYPADTLLTLIVSLLAPLFMGGNIDSGLVRMAAIETLSSYRMRNQAEMLCIAQIIGFGLAAMDTLRLSMLPDLAVAVRLRLRGCANALNRSAQVNLRSLERTRQAADQAAPRVAAVAPPVAAEADERFSEARVRAAVDETRDVLRDIQARLLEVPSVGEPRRPEVAVAGIVEPMVARAVVQPACIQPGDAGVAPPVVAPPVVAPPVVASPGVVRPVFVQPVVAPPGVAPPAFAPPAGPTPIVASPDVARPVVAPPVVAQPVSASPAAPVVATPVVAASVIAATAPATGRPVVAAAARVGVPPGAASSQPGTVRPPPGSTAASRPSGMGPAPFGKPGLLSQDQLTNLLWASAMTDVAGELTGNGAAIRANPMSQTDRMWADALVSAARHLSGGAPGARPQAKTGPLPPMPPPKRR